MSRARAEFVDRTIRMAEALDAAWARFDRSEEAFSALATEHLQSAALHTVFDLEGLVHHTLTSPDLPPQQDPQASFAEPPITLFAGRRFYVAALVWRTATTTIHQHAFTGAFQVLQGSSVHARHAFAAERAVTERLLVGRLTSTGVEALAEGDVRPIVGGPRGIHALFHLEEPSVSLVVRTYHDARHPIQYTYSKSGFAFDLPREDTQLRRKRQVTAMATRSLRDGLEPLLRETLPSMPALDAFAVLVELAERGEPTMAERLVTHVPASLAALRAELSGLVRRTRRDGFIKARRADVGDADLRYFLALLLNTERSTDVLALAKHRSPESAPEDTVVRWVEALANVRLRVLAGAQVWEPSAFVLPDVDAPSLEALRRMLLGESAAHDPGLPFLDALRSRDEFAPLFCR